MTDSNVFSADADRVGGAVSKMSAVGDEAGKIGDDFNRGVARYDGWAGSDEFGESADRQLKYVVRTLTEGMNALVDAIYAVPNALLGNSQYVKRGQQDVSEAIGAAASHQSVGGHGGGKS